MPQSNRNIVAWVLGLLALCCVVPVGAQTVSKILGADSATVADVVPGNTAPAASKKALVVSISPNSPSPAGSQDVNLIKVGGAAIAIGQAAMAASLPVAIASNQSTLAISAAALPLPTGAATSALQTTGNASLSSIDGKLGTLGQKTMAGSAPVVIASDQSAITVTGSLTPSGTQDVNLTKVGGAAVALGQAVMASSIPIAIASNQSAIPASQSGTWTVQQGTPPWTVTGTGTAGTAATGVVSVQGITSMTPIQVSQATASNLNAQVVGPAANGAAVSGNPVRIGLSDGATTRDALGDSSGRLIVVGPGVAGTPTGGVQSVQGVSGGQALPISGTVTITPSGTQNVNLTQVGGASVALGQAANAASIPVTISSTQTGTAGSAAAQVLTVQGVASMTPVQVSQATASNLNAQVVGAAASGAAVSGNPVLIAGSNAGTARSVSVDASGQQVVVGPGTAGSASGGVLTVQGVASMTPVQVSQSTASNLNATVVGTASDNSANSTAKLPVIPARANAAAPSWTEGNQVPLSTDLGGLLRTYMGSWLGSTAPTVGQKANASSIPVTLSSDQVGTAGTAAAGVQTIQGIASMTPVQVSQATAANLNAQVVISSTIGASKTVISTNTTTIVKASAGVLYAIIINAGTGSSMAGYDDAGGGTTNQFISKLTASDSILEYGPIGVAFTNGLTIVTASGTPAFITVVWK